VSRTARLVHLNRTISFLPAQVLRFAGALVLFAAAAGAFAEDTTPPPTTTLFIFRTGERLDSPHIGTYHFLEFLQARRKWIYPDIGYVDYATGSYRELFLGGGRTLYNGKPLTLIEELYFVQATGPAAGSARYIWPWTMLQVRFTPKLANETVYFLYVPLNDSARVQHVLERSKLEYSLNRRWKMGGGYGGYKFAETKWQNKPFVTATFSSRIGDFEAWLQKLPVGAQVQVRYQFVHSGH